MKLRQLLNLTFVSMLASTLPLAAQTLKARQVRIIVSAPAGSAPDVIARILGDQFRTSLGATVLVENRPGAGGILAVNSVKGGPRDGTTLLFAQAAVVVVSPLTYKEAKFDMERDFEAIATVANTPMLFVANPEKGPKSFAAAVTQARSSPDHLVMGSPSRTSIPHLTALMVDQLSGSHFSQVPLGSSGQAIQAVMNGDTQVSVDGVAALLPLVKSGRLRALAVTSAKPMPGIEGIPLAQSVVPNMQVSGWFALFAPKGTPSAVLEELNGATNVALKNPDAVSRMAALGNYPMGGSVADASAFVKKEKATWADVIRRAQIEME